MGLILKNIYDDDKDDEERRGGGRVRGGGGRGTGGENIDQWKDNHFDCIIDGINYAPPMQSIFNNAI